MSQGGVDVALPNDPFGDLNKDLEELQAAEDQRKADQALYEKRIAAAASEKGFALAITLLYVIMANYPSSDSSQDTSGATISGHFENDIEVSGDGLNVMGGLTKYVNGLESQFNNKSGTTADLQSFAHNADVFLDNSGPGSALDKAVPGSALSTIRAQILAMRQDIKITNGDTRYNPPAGTKYHLTDDLHDKTASHSFSELYENAQKPGTSSGSATPGTDDSLDARTAVQNFTNGFQLVSSVADGANSSLKLQTDQQTKDLENFTSFFNSWGLSFFKPGETAVGNQTR
jgi:hypothetical protein